MDKHDLERPWQYKKDWLVFPGSVLNHIEIVDCNDTTRGVCIDNKTVEGCIDFCERDGKYCGAGYHIQFKDDRSICVPLLTSIHPNINPVHRLRRQSIYPELDNVFVSTFINTKKFPFPPEQANVVFFMDILNIKSEGSKATLGGKEYQIEGGEITGFSKDGNLNLNLLPLERTVTQVARYRPLKYGDYFNVNVPGTSLLLAKNIHRRNLEWIQGRGLAEPDYAKFQAFPVSDEKSVGDLVNYGDDFTIHYNDIELAVEDKTHGTFTTIGIDPTLSRIKKNIYPYFSFVSRMKGYYCEDGKCKSVPVKDMQQLGDAGRYKGVTVGRDPNCWGMCPSVIPGTNEMIPFSTVSPDHLGHPMLRGLIVVSAMLLIVAILVIHFLTRKK